MVADAINIVVAMMAADLVFDSHYPLQTERQGDAPAKLLKAAHAVLPYLFRRINGHTLGDFESKLEGFLWPDNESDFLKLINACPSVLQGPLLSTFQFQAAL